jgi:hypothetical protein
MKGGKGAEAPDHLRRPAAGLEAEFTLFIDDEATTPERVFGDPRGFIELPLMHRTGRSFHLPTGAAVYFDTGVIELATPVMELERGCFARLARSLDDSLSLVRAQLDTWERRTGHLARLQGFSAHYNVSPVVRGHAPGAQRFDGLAWLLAHVLPAPVMLIATNRLSTGVGVRPRPPRVEITADFSPDPWRMAAVGAVIAGIVTEVSTWPDLRMSTLNERGIPVVSGFQPMTHTSRQGWLARFDCYPRNPFTCAPDDEVWDTTTGRASLRAIAQEVWRVFARAVARIADPRSLRIARDIIHGDAPSWLDHAERPHAYDDAGRRGRHVGAAEMERLGRSPYERIVLHTIARRPLRMADGIWTPEAVRGWSRVVFRRADGARRVLTLDALIEHLDRWGIKAQG